MPTHAVTPERMIVAVAIYAALMSTVFVHTKRIPRAERRTYVVLGLAWGGSVFAANYVLYLAGLMSFLPWANNFLHAFVWIGACLGWLYLGVRTSQPMLLQFLVFATYSLVVKHAEQIVFGTWEHDHFFWVLSGNAWYVLGWSLLDGLYPLISLHGLRVVGRFVKGLIVV